MSKTAAIWAALEAIAVGAVREAEAILLSAVEDDDPDEGTANPVLLRPAGGRPGEQPWWKS